MFYHYQHLAGRISRNKIKTVGELYEWINKMMKEAHDEVQANCNILFFNS